MVTLTSYWRSPRELQVTDYEVELKVTYGFLALTAVTEDYYLLGCRYSFTCCLLLARCLLGLLFDLEDGGRMFLQNVGQLLADHMALHPRSQYSTSHVIVFSRFSVTIHGIWIVYIYV
jgi:hypothetical protein